MQYAYASVFLLSLILIPLYFRHVYKKKDEPWLLILFLCVATVNLGYTLVAVSNTVSFALFANKITYLGQVMVGPCMLMIVSKLCGYRPQKWVVALALTGAALMFALVCTTGYLDWYYTSATIEKVAGATVLYKEYGPLHPTNLIYVIFYFVTLLTVLCFSLKDHKGAAQKHAAIMLIVVLGNIAMWLVQKVIPWNFELLSITYVMSAGAFFGVWYMLQDYVLESAVPKYTVAEGERLATRITALSMEEKLTKVLSFVNDEDALAFREREILEMILASKKRKEIASELHLSENTVKTYTRTLYSKLGVTCREELYALLLQDDTKNA